MGIPFLPPNLFIIDATIQAIIAVNILQHSNHTLTRHLPLRKRVPVRRTHAARVRKA